MGLSQFLDQTWIELIRAHRPDLVRGRSERETLELRREPKLAREITMRLVERNIAMLRQRGLPVTAGTVYLAHFAGSAGAVAILSAPDNADAALVIASADSTRWTKRKRLIRANPFLEHFTVADLKAWADRRMRGPDVRLTEMIPAGGADRRLVATRANAQGSGGAGEGVSGGGGRGGAMLPQAPLPPAPTEVPAPLPPVPIEAPVPAPVFGLVEPDEITAAHSAVPMPRPRPVQLTPAPIPRNRALPLIPD